MGEGLEKVIVGCKKCKCNFIKCKMTSPIIKHSRAATLGTKKKKIQRVWGDFNPTR